MAGIHHLDGQPFQSFDARVHLGGIIHEFASYRPAVFCREQISAEELALRGQDANGA